MNLRILSLLLVTFLLIACQNQEQAKQKVYIAAASDLHDAFTELGSTFQEETGIEPIFTFGSTGLLTQQIEQGAPFDLFAAAHESFIDKLAEKKLIVDKTKQIYALGQIGYLFNEEFHSFRSIEDLLSPEIKTIAIANPEHAPYGKAAREALEHAGIWEVLQDKLVYGENISQSLQFVETGNADIGIIAKSLSIKSDLMFLEIDPSQYQPLIQALAIPTYAENQESAQAFIDYLFSSTGQAIMESYGFELPKE